MNISHFQSETDTNYYYTDLTGKRKQKKKEGFVTKKEAQAYEKDFLNKCETSVEIQFKNLVEKYIEDCRARLRPTTLANKEHLISTKILPYFADMRVCDTDVLQSETGKIRLFYTKITTLQHILKPYIISFEPYSILLLGITS